MSPVAQVTALRAAGTRDKVGFSRQVDWSSGRCTTLYIFQYSTSMAGGHARPLPTG